MPDKIPLALTRFETLVSKKKNANCPSKLKQIKRKEIKRIKEIENPTIRRDMRRNRNLRKKAFFSYALLSGDSFFCQGNINGMVLH